MGRQQTDFESVDRIDPSLGLAQSQSSFEIFVSPGFCELEVSHITHTLRMANAMLAQPVFSWRCVSDAPGFVRGLTDMIVEAAPAFEDVVLPHTMIVVGGAMPEDPAWMRRLRAMQRKMLPVVLLSDAATRYIRAAGPSGRITTHWRDAMQLAETGYYPNLSNSFSEKSSGVVTAAGGTATAELMIGLIAPFLTASQVAQLGNSLLLHTIRKSDAEQPKDIADNGSLFDGQVTAAIRHMEDNIAEPLQMTQVAERVGVSTRHLERAFRAALADTPARFYKRLRARRARAMIEETLLPLIEIAIATGFGSTCSMSKSVREEYGQSPSKMRDRKKISLLNFAE